MDMEKFVGIHEKVIKAEVSLRLKAKHKWFVSLMYSELSETLCLWNYISM